MDERDTNTVAHEPGSKDILCVYSQADESFYLQFKKSLNLWERQGHVRWLELRPGDDLAAIEQSHVKRADLILLLLSPDFFSDEQCYQTMLLALQERVSRQVPVVPILVRAVNWRLSACKDLAIVPRNEQPVASWPLLDEAFAAIGADLVCLVPTLQMGGASLPARPRLFQARDLPKGYVTRPKAFDEIKHHLLNRLGKKTTAITTALRGAGGFGKTTLALALCHDPEIQTAFPDGILWIELGEQPPRSLDVLNGVLASLKPLLSGAITLEEARDRWHRALDGRVCLLVIDDVWQAAALSPLLEGGSHCVRLVTTRNDQVLPAEATRSFVDAMEPEEAIAVLCRGLSEEIQQEAYQPMLLALAKRLGYWPLLLTLAHGLLADQVRYGRTIALALATVEHAYQHRGITAFHLEQESERHRTADACLEVSIRHLSKSTPAHYLAETRYQELAIFPEDADLPLATLHTFWQGTGRLETWEVDELCVRLHQLSLLLTCDLGKGTIRLHDVTRNYLQQKAATHLGSIHQALLNAYHLPTWADLPLEDPYLWKHLFFHLKAAGRSEELLTTAQDLRYLAKKAFFLDSHTIEVDL